MNQRLRLGDEPGRLAALGRYDMLDRPPEPAFEEITALAQAVFGTPMVAISLVDAQRQWFLSSRGIEAKETSREVAFCHYTIQTPEPLAVDDAMMDSRFAGNAMVSGAPGIRSYLGAPLMTPDGYNIGSICVMDSAARVFTEGDGALLAKFAALVIAQLELRQIASSDGLTGALTRRAFEEEVERELARHKRYGAPVALGVFDLDHFKTVNDTYGHPVGDAVLRTTVDACRQVLRASDTLGRIGGEEFGVVIVGADAVQAMLTLRRLRAAVEAAALSDRPEVRFTASFGAVSCTPGFEKAEDWMSAADACLYVAKRAGRNRCVADIAA